MGICEPHHVAAGYAGLQRVAREQVGDDFAGTLLDDLAIGEQGKFHPFRIAVNGLAVCAIERVEFLRVSLEIYGVVCNPAFGKKGFDDLAADAVRRCIKGYAHAWEGSVSNTYKIYDNLLMNVEAAYVNLHLDGSTWRGVEDSQYRDNWRVSLTFRYQF